jgi:hypothetical protein
MPNPIKYNTSTETLSLKKGNFWIGTGDVDKGPTSTTGFYNGITPPSGGYTVYLNKASGGPSMYTVTSDAQLITLTNQIAGTSYTSTTECFVYYVGQSDKICLSSDYESIITNGLITILDAGFVSSYPKSGTTIYDVSGTNNGTLINGVGFNSGNNGSMVFDGVNDYIGILNNTTLNFTIGCWVKTTVNSLGGSEAYMGNGIVWSDVGGGANDFVLAILNNRASWFTGNPDSSVNGTTTINTGAWFYLTATRSATSGLKQLFVNGVSEGSGTTNSSLLNANPNIIIGANTLDTRYFNGSVGVVQIYNRVLSSSEILSNFNAQKGRFGL